MCARACAGPARCQRLSGRTDIAKFIAQRAADALLGAKGAEPPRPPGGVLYMSPEERRRQLDEQQKVRTASLRLLPL